MSDRESESGDDDISRRLGKIEKLISDQNVSIDKCYVANIFLILLQITKLILNPHNK